MKILIKQSIEIEQISIDYYINTYDLNNSLSKEKFVLLNNAKGLIFNNPSRSKNEALFVEDLIYDFESRINSNRTNAKFAYRKVQLLFNKLNSRIKKPVHPYVFTKLKKYVNKDMSSTELNFSITAMDNATSIIEGIFNCLIHSIPTK